MSYPLDKSEFVEWVKTQDLDKLVDLKLVLLASQADLQIQLQTMPRRAPGWEPRARIKLRLTEWRLAVLDILLDQGCLAFQRAAHQLLDQDTYDTIIEATRGPVGVN